jgi:hypothetical protein
MYHAVVAGSTWLTMATLWMGFAVFVVLQHVTKPTARRMVMGAVLAVWLGSVALYANAGVPIYDMCQTVDVGSFWWIFWGCWLP